MLSIVFDSVQTKLENKELKHRVYLKENSLHFSNELENSCKKLIEYQASENPKEGKIIVLWFIIIKNL
jgi:hypothetical protein